MNWQISLTPARAWPAPCLGQREWQLVIETRNASPGGRLLVHLAGQFKWQARQIKRLVHVHCELFGIFIFFLSFSHWTPWNSSDVFLTPGGRHTKPLDQFNCHTGDTFITFPLSLFIVWPLSVASPWSSICAPVGASALLLLFCSIPGRLPASGWDTQRALIHSLASFSLSPVVLWALFSLTLVSYVKFACPSGQATRRDPSD